MSYKKWIYRYKYLKYDLDETKELREKYVKDFNSKFLFKDKKEPVVVIPEGDELISPPKKPKNKKVKSLYKTLSKKLHPDKGGNEKDFNELNDFYESENILEMAIKAEELNIEIENINEYFTDDNFLNLCSGLEEQTSFIKTTLAWKWAIASEEEKKILIVLFEQQHGVVPIKK
jgi:hypothetical protein|tara:strand:+ start:74 stop:595 length:522 start_codon:yes stop_codon:yes gene_type:complete